MKIYNNKKRKYILKQVFYAFDKIVYDIIVNFFQIIKANFYVN